MEPFFLEKQLNKNIPIPLYYQLKELILEYIDKAIPDSRLPTEDQLAGHFAISRSTVRQALGELTAEGHLVRHKGKGTMIVPRKIEQEFLEVLESFNDEMQEKGLVPHTQVLTLKKAPASGTEAAALKILPGDEVVRLVRLRSTNGEPIVLVETSLPAGINGLAGLVGDDLEKHSLYQLMENKYGTTIESSRRSLEIRTAGEFEARHLRVPLHAPLQYIETVAYTADRKPVEFSRALYRADRNKFILEIRKKKL
jgi:GntR family transcriptional regulator